ncbi:MAG TPA: EAL domain-containing protein [Rugosimonospora sp.]|nr:EAL domain-containing protein [Rugosimonospora sp.]
MIVLSAVLALAAVGVQCIWLRDGFPALTRDGLAVGLLTAAFALCERFLVVFPVRRGSHSISLSEIPLVLGLIAVPPEHLALARVLGGALGLVLLRRQSGSKLGFNLSLYAVEASVASLAFAVVAGPAGQLGPRGWLGAFIATLLANVLSIVLVTAAIALHDDAGAWRALLRSDLRRDPQLLMVAVTTSLALVTGLVVHADTRAGVLLGVLALAAYAAFRRYAQQTQGHAQVEALYHFTKALDGFLDQAEVTRIVLAGVRDLVRAESAELIVCVREDASVLRVQMYGQDQVRTGHAPLPRVGWWLPAQAGTPVLRPAGTAQLPDGSFVDGMAVPLAIGHATWAVLLVSGSLPDIPTFDGQHLRLLQALANHAGVALTNVHLVDRLRHIGLHDPVTDLPNRRQFQLDIEAALAEPAGTAAVFLLDLDRFQEVNDALGHDTGDGLLGEIGDRVRAHVAGRGSVARLGGDEFAVLLPGISLREAAVDAADLLRQVVEQPVPVSGLALTTQASVGVALAPAHGKDANRLLQRADVAMYAAKRDRSGVRVYRPEDDQNSHRRLALIADLRDAVHRGALRVAYQPQVDPGTGRVLGAEALSRWPHPSGPVPPDRFIPLAERCGLIRALTLNVLESALLACQGWRASGYELAVAVNLSPHSFDDAALTDQVATLLAKTGVPAGALTLEITENGVMDNPAQSAATLHALRALGVTLSIDDFGTGHSSLGRLADLPIQEIKIDKSFVRGLTHDRGRRAVTGTAIQLAHTLDLTVVAEGVEDISEYEYLRDHGCDRVQGYYTCRPLPPEQLIIWLRNMS